jgi:hypothetical protein
MVDFLWKDSIFMNMSTKYTGHNMPESFISSKRKIVIHNVPIGIIRAMRHHSEMSGDSVRDTGSISKEAYKAIRYYLKYAKHVNVDEIEKSIN